MSATSTETAPNQTELRLAAGEKNVWANRIDKRHTPECKRCSANFIRGHKTLRVSPAMAAGVTDKLWSMDGLCEMINVVAPKAGPRGPYKRKPSPDVDKP